MRIAVYEYAIANLQPRSYEFLGEGYAMASTLCEAFTRSGLECTVLLSKDSHGMKQSLESHGVKSEITVNLEDTLNRFDFAIIIAPETEHILSRLVKRYERLGVELFNGGHEHLATAEDKWLLFQVLRANNVKTPSTSLIRVERLREQALQMEFPFVIKSPIDTGARSLTVVHDSQQLAQCLDAYTDHEEELVIQNFVPGVAASVTILMGDDCYPLCLNRQRLKLSHRRGDSRYLGGLTPYVHQDLEEAFKVAVRAVKSVGGLRGLLGVDIILGNDGVWVVELNPRATTPIAALATLDPQGLAESIVKVQKGEEPGRLSLKGVCSYRRMPYRRRGAVVPRAARWFPPLYFPLEGDRLAIYTAKRIESARKFLAGR
jgi:predicted ATP-grasp superfamily ATP-dependent carboligase